MGSGISTLLFFQGLCETLTHSAWTKAVHVKRKAPLFGCTVCTCWMAGSVAGILGYLIKLWCYFSAVSIKAAACYWLYANKMTNKMLNVKDRLLWLYALAKK